MEDYYYFLIHDYQAPFGYIHRSLVEQMPWPSYWDINQEQKTATHSEGTDFKTRTELMQQTLRVGIESPKVSILTGWDNEIFPLYAADGQHVLDIDGMGLDGFGVINYAVHMIGWINTTEGTKYWVPRRAKTKMTYPNMLDNTVGEISLRVKNLLTVWIESVRRNCA